MTDRVSPVVARRRLATELRRFRTASRMTLEDVARALECSAGKISRIENGAVRAGIQDVRALADLYFGLEFAASAINMYSPALVPGLLQTPDYARTLMNAMQGVPAATIDRRVELRLRRQELLVGEHPPACTFLIDATALDREVGSRSVRREPLRHLVTMAQHGNLVILLVPNVVHSATQTNFTIFEFAGELHTKVVYIEHLSSNVISNDPEDVRIHTEVFEQAQSVCHSAQDSIAMIEARIQAV